jgi:hypothetical protein
MQDIAKIERARRARQQQMANMRSRQTRATGHLDIVLAGVALVQTQLVKITGEVIVGAAVHVLVGVNGVGQGHGVASVIVIVLGLECMVEVVAVVEPKP